jgi:hypothetical protein
VNLNEGDMVASAGVIPDSDETPKEAEVQGNLLS